MADTKNNRFFLTIGADKHKIDDARLFVEGSLKKAGLDEEGVFALEVSFVELFENILKYSGVKQGDSIDIEINVKEDEITVAVTDKGVEFNLTQYQGPDPIERIKKGLGGLMGIRTIKVMCDRVDYTRKNNINTNVLVKKLERQKELI